MIRQFDNVILTKAGKVDFYDMRNVMETKMTKEEGKNYELELTARIIEFKEEMKQFDEKLGIIQEGMSKGIYEAVKKANS